MNDAKLPYRINHVLLYRWHGAHGCIWDRPLWYSARARRAGSRHSREEQCWYEPQCWRCSSLTAFFAALGYTPLLQAASEGPSTGQNLPSSAFIWSYYLQDMTRWHTIWLARSLYFRTVNKKSYLLNLGARGSTWTSKNKEASLRLLWQRSMEGITQPSYISFTLVLIKWTLQCKHCNEINWKRSCTWYT